MKNYAFTIVELIVVIAIIGILSAISVNSLMSLKGRNLKNDIYAIQFDLWWLRQKAIANHTDMQMKFYSNSSAGAVDSYCLCRGGCPSMDTSCLYMTNANVLISRHKLAYQNEVDTSPPPYVNVNAVNGTLTVCNSSACPCSPFIQLDSPVTGNRYGNVTIYNGTGYVQENF